VSSSRPMAQASVADNLEEEDDEEDDEWDSLDERIT